MNVALGVLGGLAVPVILIALIARRSRQALAELAPMLAQQAEVLEALGRALGLRHRAEAGTIGRLEGELGGVPIVVRSYQPRATAYRLQIRRRGPASLAAAGKARWKDASVWHEDGELVVVPLAPERRIQWLSVVSLDAAALRRWLADVAGLTAEG
jgi:hypothetical protein